MHLKNDTDLLGCNFTFLKFLLDFQFCLLNKTLRFSYVTAGPEISAYGQFTRFA